MSRLTPESIRASQAELPPIGTVITELRRQDPYIQQEQHRYRSPPGLEQAWQCEGNGSAGAHGRGRLQEQADTAGTAQRPADGLTSTTVRGTGERDAMRRASCTSDVVPGPPGKASTSTEVAASGEVWAMASAMANWSSSRLRIGPAARPWRSQAAGRAMADQPS